MLRWGVPSLEQVCDREGLQVSTIYLPGRGLVNLAHRRVEKAVHAYDERLFASTNPHTGFDTIFIKMPPDTPDDFGITLAGQRAFPVLSFPEGFPANEEHVVAKLASADSARFGDKVLRDVHAANEKAREPHRAAAAEADGIVAERVEHARRELGVTPYHISYPKKSPKQQGR